MNPLLLILGIAVFVYFFVGRKQIAQVSKDAWKQRFGIILILILFTSCAAHKSEWRRVQGPMYVYKTIGDSAEVRTMHFDVPYYTAAKGRTQGEEFYCIGAATSAGYPREFYLKIFKAIPLSDTTEIRRANKIERYLKLMPPK